MEEQDVIQDLSPIRRTYSWIGVCFVVLLVVATAAQLFTAQLMVWLLGEHNAISSAPWWIWVASTVPMYLLAFPLCFLMLRRLPSDAPEKRSLGKRQLLALIPIAVCVMYFGNVIGSILSLLLSGGTAQNAVAELAMDDHPLKYVMMVLVAPVFEELLCRKALLDRVRHHGEFLSAVMSGVVFGLLHQNFYQFFYAFALGLLFARLYLQSGRIGIPILFHMGINFLGAVVAPAVLNLLDMPALESLMGGNVSVESLLAILPGYAVLMLYSGAMLGLSVFGLVLLIRFRCAIVWQSFEPSVPWKVALKPALFNVGMVVYMVLCAATFVWSLFA